VSDQTFIAKTETPNDIGALQRIGRIHFDVKRIHLFDRESGRVLSHA
jgi:multiple sugar transport system ATP-binding protein